CSGTSAPVAVTFHPVPTPEIDGPGSVCLNATVGYTASNIAGDSYQWSISAGGTIITGQGTSQITVRWGGAGVETVDLEQTSSATGCRGNAGQYVVKVGTVLTPKI